MKRTVLAPLRNPWWLATMVPRIRMTMEAYTTTDPRVGTRDKGGYPRSAGGAGRRTGGFIVSKGDSVHAAMRRILEDLSAYYEVTYVPASADLDGLYHNLRFEKIPGAPEPVSFETKRRVSFNEVDVMGIVWYGQYAVFFEQAQTELGRHCGLSYQDYYVSNLRAPIVKFHIDYFQPLYLDEEFSIKASYIWCEGAKLCIEYAIIRPRIYRYPRLHRTDVY